MFGSRKKALKDELQKMKNDLQKSDEIVENLADRRPRVEGCYSEMSESADQLREELGQVGSNTDTTLEYVSQNAEAEKHLEQKFIELQQSVNNIAENSKDTAEKLNSQNKRWRQLLDTQKQYEAPVQYLNEVSSSMLEQNKEYLDKTGQMTALGKEMGVLALTAAIEASRMGDTGAKFVETAQKIRDQSAEYERIAAALKSKIEADESRIQKLEEQVRILAELHNENNSLETAMFTYCNQAAETALKVSDNLAATDFTEIKEQITGLWNVEQEIMKVQKRNQLQIEDMKEEYQAWQQITDDAVQMIQPVMESASEYIRVKGE